MNINFIAMGKLKESWYREACAEYMKRLGAYVSPKVIEPSRLTYRRSRRRLRLTQRSARRPQRYASR